MLVKNERPRTSKPNPLRADPTRMGLIRGRFDAEIKKRFRAVLADLRKLIVEDDGFGLLEPKTYNAFCPTGKGGGIDSTCSKRPQRDDAKGRGTYRIFYRASYDEPDSKPRSIVVKSPSAYLAMRGFKKRYGSVALLDLKVVNSFCPTGPGGGIDPTCSLGKGGETKKLSVSEAIRKAEELAAKTGVRPYWLDRPAVYQSSSRSKGRTLTQTAVNWRKIESETKPGRLKNIYDAWRKERDDVTGMASWDRVSKRVNLSVEDVAREIKHYHLQKEAEHIAQSVDRAGGSTYFKFKKPPIVNRRETPTTNAPYRFRFATSVEQIAQFQQWLSQRLYYHLLGTTLEQVERAWWKQYVEEGYRKGAGRAFDDVKKPLHKPDTWSERMPWYDGTRREFLESSFGRAVRVEKVKLLAGRVYTELKGVTEEMSKNITRSMTDGLVQGKSAWDIYKKMAEDAGVSERRSMLIARTELTRVHAESQLDAMEEMGVEAVNVMVEWNTAGDLRVCKLCQPLEGVVFKIQEARGLIPRHPACRCALLPANVGEGKGTTKVDWQKKPIPQTRTQRGVEGAVKESLRVEGKGRKTTWPGADVSIAKVRPKSIANVYCPTGEGGGKDPTCQLHSGARHSNPADWPSESNSNYYYHATEAHGLQSIKNNGLSEGKVMKHGKGKGKLRLSVAQSTDAVKEWLPILGTKSPILLRIKRSSSDDANNIGSNKDEVRVTGPIDVSRIEVFYRGRWVSIVDTDMGAHR